MEKYYIMHYPSSFGMGSDTDVSLISESDLRLLIRNELAKKAEGKRYDERFTGEWKACGELPCDSADIETVIDDVIAKRTTGVSTYAAKPDLVEVPRGVPITVKDERLEKIIVRVYGDRFSECDVVIGEGIFHRHILDLEHYKGEGLSRFLDEMKKYEFVSCELKNVLINELLLNSADSLVRRYMNLIGRELGLEMTDLDTDSFIAKATEVLASRLDNGELSEDTAEDVREMIGEIKPLAHIPALDDEYEKHRYMQYYGFFEDMFTESLAEGTEDHTKMYYVYPDAPHLEFEPGCICSQAPRVSRYFTYSDLFVKGGKVNYLPAALIYDSDESGQLNAFLALERLFAVF